MKMCFGQSAVGILSIALPFRRSTRGQKKRRAFHRNCVKIWSVLGTWSVMCMHRTTRKMQRVSCCATLWFRHELLGAHFTRRGAWFLSNTTNRIRYFCMKASPLPAYHDVHDGDSCISVLCDDAQNPLIQRCQYLCSCSVAKAKHAIP